MSLNATFRFGRHWKAVAGTSCNGLHLQIVHRVDQPETNDFRILEISDKRPDRWRLSPVMSITLANFLLDEARHCIAMGNLKPYRSRMRTYVREVMPERFAKHRRALRARIAERELEKLPGYGVF